MDIQEKMIFKSREDEAKERSKKVAQELHQAARDKRIKEMLHNIHHAHEKTMSEDTEHLGNVVGLVANHDFAGATEIVHDLLNQRVVGALDAYKQTVAKNLFSPVPAELEEEIEQLDELDKKTLASYVNKSTNDVVNSVDQAHHHLSTSHKLREKGNAKAAKQHLKMYSDSIENVSKRQAGIRKALDKLVK